MLEVSDEKYLAEVREHADKVGLREDLEKGLKYLDEYAEHGDRGKTKCQLSKDFAPYSFAFVMMRRRPEGEEGYDYYFNGGLIYHGPHDNGGDGSFPTLSVTLTPTHGWQVHT